MNMKSMALNSFSKIDKTKVLEIHVGGTCSLVQVESNAECSIGAFCNTFDLHSAIIGFENILLDLHLSDNLRHALRYCNGHIEDLT